MSSDVRKLKEEAAKAVEKGKWKRAAELYDAMVKLQWDDVASVHRAAEAYRKLGQMDVAIARFGRAAALYGKQGFLVKAIAVCKVILEAQPEHTETQSMLAQLYAEQKAGPRQPALTPSAMSKSAARRAVPKPTGTPVAAAAAGPAARGAPLEAVRLSQLSPSAQAISPRITLIPVAPDFDDGAAEAGPSVMPRTPLFSALASDELRWLIEQVKLLRVENGETVFLQGNQGDALYVIAHGEVAVVHTQEGSVPVEMARLGEGAFFGEIALVTDRPRSASVVATRPSELIEISRKVVSDLLARSPATLGVVIGFLRDRLCDTLMATSQLFAPFSPSDRRELVKRFRFLEIEAGHAVVQEGERSGGLYVIAAGCCEVASGDRIIAKLGPGDLFGEMSLLRRTPASATVKTQNKCYVLELPREAFTEVIQTHPQVLEYASTLADERDEAVPLL